MCKYRWAYMYILMYVIIVIELHVFTVCKLYNNTYNIVGWFKPHIAVVSG